MTALNYYAGVIYVGGGGGGGRGPERQLQLLAGGIWPPILFIQRDQPFLPAFRP
jgi:hypothetical protein